MPAKYPDEKNIEKLAEYIAKSHKHTLLVGPPGTGKTMIARRVAKYMPPITRWTPGAATIHQIQATAYRRPLEIDASQPPPERPFRAPHHTVSLAGMIGAPGSARHPGILAKEHRYGELSLAHGGVLFLDELPEFRRPVLEAVAHAIRDGEVVHRTRSAIFRFPAQFRLVAAMSPCACGLGWSGASLRCSCTKERIKSYRSRIALIRPYIEEIIDLSEF